MSEHHYRYVPYSLEKKYEALGWRFHAFLGFPHCCYASLYIWDGEGEPVEPEKDIQIYPAKKAHKEEDDDLMSWSIPGKKIDD